MQIIWRSMYFSCLTSLINTVFLSLIHIVKDILQMSYFIKYLGCFQLGANTCEIYYNHLMHFNDLCGGQ